MIRSAAGPSQGKTKGRQKGIQTLLLQGEVSDQILAKKVDMMHAYLPVALLVNLVIALGLAYTLSSPENRVTVSLWGLGTLLVSGGRFLDRQAWLAQAGDPERLARWRQGLVVGAAAQGCLWGVAGLLLYPSTLLEQQFLLTVLGGMSAGAVVFLAPIYTAFLVYMIPALIPVSCRLLAEGQFPHRALGAMGLVFALAMVFASRKISLWLEEALASRFEMEALSNHLEAANSALGDYKAHLEAEVEQRTLDLSIAHDELRQEFRAKEQEHLRAANTEVRYRALLDAMGEGFAHLDVNEVFLFANPSAEAIFGVSAGTLAGRSLFEFLQPGIADFVRDQTALRIKGEPSTYTHDIVRGDGLVRTLQVKVTPVWDAALEYAGASAVFRDVTEQRLNEETLRQAQKLEGLGVLAGGIAHDFNNLLGSILGNLSLLEVGPALDASGQNSLALMERSVVRASELTQQLLAYSGRGRFLVRDLDLNLAVRELTHSMRASLSPGAELRLELEPDLPAVAADREQVQQVVLSLAHNASEALQGPGGVIRIATYLQDLDAAMALRASQMLPLASGLHIVMEVSDTGAGMDRDLLSRIFDPFFTTRGTGRGLGLSATLGILRGHRAGVGVESEVGRGSTFRVYFPVSFREPVIASSGSPEYRLVDRRHVLLVDDDPVLLETAQALLRNLGWAVVTARDGMEALERWEVHQAEIGLVLLDLTMPRMDGYQTFLELRRLCPDLPVVITSGYDAKQSLQSFTGPGLPGFLQKPYSRDQLAKALDAALCPPGLPER